jgi:hypothetical protein
MINKNSFRPIFIIYQNMVNILEDDSNIIHPF